MNKKRIVIISTEPSGDLLGSELMDELKHLNKNISFFGIGGDLMKKRGLNSIIPIKFLAVNGIIEVLIKVISFLKYLKLSEKYIRQVKPEIIITIDSPSFNYRLVEKLQDLRGRVKMIHYVAPTVWAWKKYRAKKFASLYDLMLTLFSFEPEYFLKYNLKSVFVGHPLFFKKREKSRRKKLITFFPGSRLNEIKRVMPLLKKIMKKLSVTHSDYELKILTIPIMKDEIKKIINNENFQIIHKEKEKDQAIQNSHFAVAVSGTISLELASFKVPMIILYKSNFLTSLIILSFVKTKWASLINIIFDKEIVPELLFYDCNYSNLLSKIEEFLVNQKKCYEQKKYFDRLANLMLKQKDNSPSKLAAKEILGIK